VVLRRGVRLVGTYARKYASLRFDTYLVGNSFTVADLTAASLFYPQVTPEGGPTPPEQAMPADFQALRDELAERPGYNWVEDTYRRHRAAASLVT
jgi:glutathione S-transferase